MTPLQCRDESDGLGSKPASVNLVQAFAHGYQPFLPWSRTCPDSLLRLWCYINPLYAYLLTYLGRVYNQNCSRKCCIQWLVYPSGVARNLRQGVRKVVIFDSGRRFPDTSSRHFPRCYTFRCCSCSKGLVTSRSNSPVVTSLAENVNVSK